MNYFILIMVLFCVVIISIGQILFKLTSEKIPDDLSIERWTNFLFSPIFLSAIALYAFATVLWIFTLKKVSLSVAYPFMALAFIIVPLLSYIFLNEKISTNTIIGTVFIIMGLIIAAR